MEDLKMFRKPALLTQLVYVILLFGLIILKWSNIISFEASKILITILFALWVISLIILGVIKKKRPVWEGFFCAFLYIFLIL
ncbi:TPA_asm: hypothetical protein GZO29_14320 [Listeria monocytogenes]|nr:hypothetical protein [Listeria monocytogenes]